MRIQYVGLAGIRLIRDYRWEEGNGFVADVDAQTAAELLTYPRPDFRLSNDDPLLALEGMTEILAAHLALYGVGSIDDVANLSPVIADSLSERISMGLLESWVEQAQTIVDSRPVEAPAEITQDGPEEGQEE